MLKASIKEYELLKKDLTDMKQYINTYLGYIIGSNGVLMVIASIFFKGNPNETLIMFGLFYVSLITLFLLYNIIRYKFNSHNKLAGFVRLISQENDYSKYNGNNDNSHIKINEPNGIILSWEYIMARWETSIEQSKCPKNKFKRLKFDFDFNNDDTYKKTNYEAIKEHFLCDLIFKNNRKKKFWRNILSLKRNSRKYAKYHFDSWKYPRNVFNSFFTIYLFISVVIVLLISNAEINNCVNVFNYSFELSPEILYLVWFFPSILFLLYFRIDLYRVLQKDKSSDYYCWSFLPFRVKQLNQYSIVPVFSSTFYYRYSNSLKYLHQLNDLIKTGKNTDKEKVERLSKKMLSEITEKGDFFKYVNESSNILSKLKKKIKVIDITNRLNEKNIINNIEVVIHKGYKLNRIDLLIMKYLKYITENSKKTA